MAKYNASVYHVSSTFDSLVPSLPDANKLNRKLLEIYRASWRFGVSSYSELQLKHFPKFCEEYQLSYLASVRIAMAISLVALFDYVRKLQRNSE